jgi:hypothetical protein
MNFSAITDFGKTKFIFNFVGYGLVIKSPGPWVHISRGGTENKMSKDECESFYNQIKMNHLT